MRPAGLVAALALFAGLPAAAAPCPPDRLGADAKRVEAGAVRLAYRIVPGEVRVGAPFSVEVVACLDGGKAAPRRIRVDASMPVHGHGMNTRPSERKIGPGHSRFDGFVFHMPGRWQLAFDVYGAGGRQRLTATIDLKR